MALITLRQLLDYAAEHSFGVPAFNVNNMDADVLQDKMADYTWKLWGMSYTSPNIELIT